MEAAEAVDLHSHLFPASYGPALMHFGIDALLTASSDTCTAAAAEHPLACSSDLVAQYLAVSPLGVAEFAALPTKRQAEPACYKLPSYQVTKSPSHHVTSYK